MSSRGSQSRPLPYVRVVSDMSKCRIVAGALLEGDGGDDVGNAGTWIQLVLMLEEVGYNLDL